MAMRRWASRFGLVLVGFTAIVGEVGAEQPAEAPSAFRAGAAKVNVTPFLGEPIVGNFATPPASYVHDELHVRSLVLDDGTTRIAFVVCDNVGITREVFDAARTIVAEKAGVSPGNLLAAATHTHSGTSARSKNFLKPDVELLDYQRFLARRIADAVQLAVGNLEPAKVGHGAVDVPKHLFNRRWLLKPGTTAKNPFGGVDRAQMNPGANPDKLEPAGPVDPQVSFLSVQAADGRPIALLANYSLHYVGGVPEGHISADYFAVFAQRIGELLGVDVDHQPPFVGILTNGTSGDVNNIDLVSPRPANSPAPYDKMKLVADDVARAVAAAHAAVVFETRPTLAAVSRELTLATRKPTAEQWEYVQSVLAKPNDAPQYHSLERVYAQRAVDQVEAPDEVSILLQTFRIGDVGISAIPFEVFAETGLEIKAKSPFAATFTIELANGSYGYLPAPRHFELGGYETWLGTNKVEPDAASKIVETLLQMFNELQDSPAGSN